MRILLTIAVLLLLLAGGIYLYLWRQPSQLLEVRHEVEWLESPNQDENQSNTSTAVLGQDDIPAIDDPIFSDGAWLQDEDLVIGVNLEEQPRAYMLALLSRHEIVNDQAGDVKMAVTWCPLCFTAIVFEASSDGQDLTFGVSGRLRNSNLVMYDRETGSNWSQALGEALDGPLEGTRLTVLPSSVLTWGEWRSLHPATVALEPAAGPTRPTDPYSSYYENDGAGLSWLPEAYQDERMEPKDLVFGLVHGNESRAYPLRANQTLLINDELGGADIVVVLDGRTRAAAYHRPAATTFEHLQGDVLSTSSGGRYSLFDGHSLDDQDNLTLVRSQISFWFSWKDHYPETTLFVEVTTTQSEGPSPVEGLFTRTTLVLLVAAAGILGLAAAVRSPPGPGEEE